MSRSAFFRGAFVAGLLIGPLVDGLRWPALACAVAVAAALLFALHRIPTGA